MSICHTPIWFCVQFYFFLLRIPYFFSYKMRNNGSNYILVYIRFIFNPAIKLVQFLYLSFMSHHDFAFWYRNTTMWQRLMEFLLILSSIGFLLTSRELLLGRVPVGGSIYIIRLCIDPSYQSIILIQKVLPHLCVCGRSAYTLLKANSSESGLQSKCCKSVYWIRDTLRWSPSSSCRLACDWEDLESNVMPSKAEDILSGFRV